MNRKLIGVLLLTFGIALLGTGCRKGVPITPFGKTLRYSGKTQTDAAKAEHNTKIQQAILEAGRAQNWIMKAVKDGVIEGTYYIRSHTAIVTIQYDATHYTITYKNSVNLNYKDGNIHPNYRKWVQKLQQQIEINIANSTQ